jgi:hypothetical protein
LIYQIHFLYLGAPRKISVQNRKQAMLKNKTKEKKDKDIVISKPFHYTTMETVEGTKSCGNGI